MLEEFDVALHAVDLVYGHELFDAALNGRGLVLGKIVAGLPCR